MSVIHYDDRFLDLLNRKNSDRFWPTISVSAEVGGGGTVAYVLHFFYSYDDVKLAGVKSSFVFSNLSELKSWDGIGNLLDFFKVSQTFLDKVWRTRFAYGKVRRCGYVKLQLKKKCPSNMSQSYLQRKNKGYYSQKKLQHFPGF